MPTPTRGWGSFCRLIDSTSTSFSSTRTVVATIAALAAAALAAALAAAALAAAALVAALCAPTSVAASP